MDEITWMFTNEYKTLFLILTESGSRGYVIDTRNPPYVRVATEEDKITNQYTQAKFIRRKDA